MAGRAPHGPRVPTCNCPASPHHCADEGHSVPWAAAGHVWGQKKGPSSAPPSQESSGGEDREQHLPPVLPWAGGASSRPQRHPQETARASRGTQGKNLEHEFPALGSAFTFVVKESGGYHRGEALGGTCMVRGAFASSPTPESPITCAGAPCASGKSTSSSAHHPCGSDTGGLVGRNRTALHDQLRSQGQGPGKGLAGWASATHPGDTASAPSTNVPWLSHPSGTWDGCPCAGGIAPKAVPVPPKHQPRSHLDRGMRSHGVSGAQGQGATRQHRCRDAVTTQGDCGGTGRCGSDRACRSAPT